MPSAGLSVGQMWDFCHRRSLTTGWTISATLVKQSSSLLEEQTRWSILTYCSPKSEALLSERLSWLCLGWDLFLLPSEIWCGVLFFFLLFWGFFWFFGFVFNLGLSKIRLLLLVQQAAFKIHFRYLQRISCTAFKPEYPMLDKSSHCIALPLYSCPFSYLLSEV